MSVNKRGARPSDTEKEIAETSLRRLRRRYAEVGRRSYPKSLRHEFDLYLEQEIEHYKDSIPRRALVRIGDEAVSRLRQAEQTSFDEVLLWAEVDRIIRERLRIPSFDTWKRYRLRVLEEYRRPERWGFSTDAPLIQALDSIEAHATKNVIVSVDSTMWAALYLAARGASVTIVSPSLDLLDENISAAGKLGVISRLTPIPLLISEFTVDSDYSGVLLDGLAVAALKSGANRSVLTELQSRTLGGGSHVLLLNSNVGSKRTLEFLHSAYGAWQQDLSPSDDHVIFTAWKPAA
jgi:hypothetical protein